jgi:hypothetical protein
MANFAISSDHRRRGHGRNRHRPATSALPGHLCATRVSSCFSRALYLASERTVACHRCSPPCAAVFVLAGVCSDDHLLGAPTPFCSAHQAAAIEPPQSNSRGQNRGRRRRPSRRPPSLCTSHRFGLGPRLRGSQRANGPLASGCG